MVEILIGVPAVFTIGGFLLLERRCIGQLAVVQPMVLCLIAGYILDQEATGIWMGISLQLLASGQSHYCNWALAGIVAAATMLILSTYGVEIEAGAPASIVLLIFGIAMGILADQFEKKQARRDSDSTKQQAPWESVDSIKAFDNLIRKRMFRSFIQGGVQSTVGVFLAAGTTFLAKDFLIVESQNINHVLVAVPVFGIAVTLSALSEYRFAAYAFVGVLAFVSMVVFV